MSLRPYGRTFTWNLRLAPRNAVRWITRDESGAETPAPTLAAGGPFLKPKNLADFKQMPIYMDYQATTPVDERVLRKMIPTFHQMFGNAHSRTHAYGWQAETLTEEGRKAIAKLINCDPKEIIFTSGATESNNLAIKGVAQFYGPNFKNGPNKPHLITLQTEHKCVLASAQYLETECGWDVTYLPVQNNGIVDVEALKKAIRPETVLISIMTVNNEIGVIQPIKQIVDIVNQINPKTLIHTDAAQAAGKMKLDVEELGVDLMSITAHKMYGPKGIGALYVRRRGPRSRVRLIPQMHGGGQERGLRSGTLPVPLIVGFGEAARIADEEMERNLLHIQKLSDKFVKQITSRLPAVTINGDPVKRFPGNCNISFDGVEGESLIMAMNQVAVSSGSACTSASLEPSYVLRALGVDEELAHTSLRFGFGKDTTEEEVDRVADLVVEAVEKLRSLSPLWEMKQSGEKDEMTWT